MQEGSKATQKAHNAQSASKIKPVSPQLAKESMRRRNYHSASAPAFGASFLAVGIGELGRVSRPRF